MAAGFVVRLAHTSALPEYSGLKYSSDFSDARQLAGYLQGHALMGGEITRQARAWLDRAVQKLEQELQQQIQPRADYQLLQSVPGIGQILGTDGQPYGVW